MPRLNQFKPGPSPGTRFGKLVVLSEGQPLVESGRPQQIPTTICKCDCGNILTIRNYVLTRKKSPAQSCGCTRRHGQSQRTKRTRTYRAWQDMKTRCRRDPRYAHVKIHPPWIDYEAFLCDMGECPDGLTLDRIRPEGHYEPSNCRWATMKVQNNNRRNNHYVTVNGKTLTVAQWMESLGLDYSTFYHRIKLGWSEQQAASTPKGTKP